MNDPCQEELDEFLEATKKRSIVGNRRKTIVVTEPIPTDRDILVKRLGE